MNTVVKIYLVVINGTLSISYATKDQFKAQRMCHRAKEISGQEHSVITRNWYELPRGLRATLIRDFNFSIL